MTKEIKAGNLYLYTMDPNVDIEERYCNIPLIAISENDNFKKLSKKNNKQFKRYPTWLCLMPDKTLGGFHPKEMIDITLK